MIEFDHIAIAGETRDLAAAYVQEALGVPLQPGGQHAHFGTHNHLLGLEDGLYLEAISTDPDAPAPPHPRWFALDDFSGPARLTNWICRTDDIEAMIKALPDAGEIVALERGNLRWRMAVPRDGHLPFDGCFPALIQWDGPHPAPNLIQCGVKLRKLVIRHPRAQELRALLSPFLNDQRVDILPSLTSGMDASFDTPSGERRLR